jgi:hypothetical protein
MGSAPEATEIPKHNGSATKNTTILAGMSFFKVLNMYKFITAKE